MDQKSVLVRKFASMPNEKIIDILNTKNFIESINACNIIASSSLHGLIFSDSYRIPNLCISIDDNLYAENFKFHDYYSAIYNTTNVEHFKPINLKKLSFETIVKSASLKPLYIDLNELELSLILHINENCVQSP